MCCESTEQLDLPAEVIEMIARYRRLLADHPWDWGDDRAEMFRWARFSRLGDVFRAFAETGDWPAAVRAVVGLYPPSGIVVVRIADEGITVRCGPARLAIVGSTTPIDIVIDSTVETDLDVRVAGHDVVVKAKGAAVQTIDVEGAESTFTVSVGDTAVSVGSAVRTVAAGRLELSSPLCARWSIVDGSGGAWFPDNVLHKWDVHDRPFFHGQHIEVVVPAEPLDVTCTRGLEYERVELRVSPVAGAMRPVDCDPPRLIDPSAEGWYGGDLHIHMNYSGDLVCAPADAARMQLGEGLHVANFVAGNCQTSLVYDREALERFVGQDLPWSSDEIVARMGVEYRNDLLGHVHAFGPDAMPTRFYAGHERSDHPEDWPPNNVACEEFRGLGATVGYPHPVFTAFPDDWSTDAFFQNPRSVEARELVIDAALGLVDSVDVISPFDDEGAIFLYHRLLSCGLRLAATAGTDTFLSFSHGPGVASNPPGWGRVYARLEDQALTVDAFKAAIRQGKTIVTNGPWLTLDLNGHGPGTVLDVHPGDRLQLEAHVAGRGVTQLALVGPDGIIAETAADHLSTTVDVERPTWIAAVARGPGTPNTLDASALAHTSPIYLDVEGSRVGRVPDAEWCLDLLDRVEHLVAEHGHFHSHTRNTRLAGFATLIDDARRFYRDVHVAAISAARDSSGQSEINPSSNPRLSNGTEGVRHHE